MRIHIKIRHADLVAYLRGDASPAIDAGIQTIRKEDPAYTAFFDLVNEIRRYPSLDLNRPPVIDKLSFEQLEDMLENLLSGNASGSDQQLFMDHLLSSASFYQRTMIKLSQMSPAMALEEIPEFAGEFVQLRSNEELLKAAGILPPDGEKPPVPAPGKKWSERIREFTGEIHDLFPSFRPAYGGLATAVVAVMLVLVGVNMTKVPYGKYWETPAFVEFNGLRGSELRSPTRSSNAPEIQSSYQNLRLLFTWVESPYNKGEYTEVIQKMASPGGLKYVQTLEKWESALGPGKAVVDSINVMEARQLLQNYYFYLATSHLGVFRNKKKALFERAESSDVTETIRLLSKAQTLAETYSINTQNRESYYLGVAYAINKDKQTARLELANVSPGSVYYPKAQALLTELQ